MYQYDTYDQAMVDARVEEFRDQARRRIEGKLLLIHHVQQFRNQLKSFLAKNPIVQ